MPDRPERCGPASPSRVAEGCEQHSLSQPELATPLEFGGHRWSLRLYPSEFAAIHSSAPAQVVALMGLLVGALLAMQLLSQSGRARQVQTLVLQRTMEFQRATRALRSKEQRFRSVFEDAPLGIYITDLDGHRLEANPASCMMLGCAAADLTLRDPTHIGEDATVVENLMNNRPVDQVVLRSFRRSAGSEVQARVLMSLLRRLREAPQCAAMAIIMVSADAMDEQIRECLEGGAQHYVTKPFHVRELLSLLDRMLAGDAGPQNEKELA